MHRDNSLDALLISRVEATPEAVKVGMAVEIVYDDVTAEVTLPKFRPS